MRLAFAFVLGIAAASAAGSAQAVGRDGEGLIGADVGAMWVPNNPFAKSAAADGYQLSAPYTVAPHVLLTFGYWIDESFELSLDAGYEHDGVGVSGKSSLAVDAFSIMATLRWIPITAYDFWPYLGASFGWAINQVSSPFDFAWGGCNQNCNNWSAVGYAEAAEVGIGWDLASNFGVSLEARFTLDLLQSPFPAALNVAGLSLLAGVYLRIPRSTDSMIPSSGSLIPPPP